MRGDTAKGGKKRKDIAGTLASRTSAGGGLGTDFDLDGGLQVTHSLCGEGFDASEDGTGRGTPLVVASTGNIAHCLNAGGMGRQDYETETMVVGSFRTAGDGAVYDSGSLSAPLTTATDPSANVIIDNRNKSCNNQTFSTKGFVQEHQYASEEERNAYKILRSLREEIGEEAFTEWGLGILDSLQRPEVLRQALHGIGVRPASFSRSWPIHCATSREEDRSEGVMRSMRELECERRSSQRSQFPEQLARQLGAYLSKLPQPGAQKERLLCDLWKSSEGIGILQQALLAIQEAWRPVEGVDSSKKEVHKILHSSERKGFMREALYAGKKTREFTTGVRRLTVEECEFLMGFPRGYTNVVHRGKPAADGPRYKAIGNSMAVPVMRWIGKRIMDNESQMS
jgi:DNA (cytosine-5)-methyltransferase 1